MMALFKFILEASTLFGSIDMCLQSDSNQVLRNVSIDCKDVSGSLDSIMVHLSGEGNSFSGNVISAVDGKVYEDSRH
jgi:uncharacterized protein (DUF2147 family)